MFLFFSASSSSIVGIDFGPLAICARVDQLLILGMGDLQPLMTGILIMGPYKPLRTWVDEFIPYYMEIMGV